MPAGDDVRKRLALLLIAGAAFAGAACTFDGVGFDDPAGEVSVVGEPFEGCEGGRSFFFGRARNTGDVELSNVTALADFFDGGGAFLGRFESPVSSGVESLTFEEGGEPVEVDVIVDSLELDQVGTFEILTTLPCGRVDRAEYSFTFTTATFEEF
jgi:hypothetical protein